MRCMSAFAFAFITLVAATTARAEVTRVDITSRTDVLGGRSYGAAGGYEWLEGRAHFALDPANPRNGASITWGSLRKFLKRWSSSARWCLRTWCTCWPAPGSIGIS